MVARNDVGPGGVVSSRACLAHGDKPVQMLRSKSKTKLGDDGQPLAYWWHKDETDQKMCFGKGYEPARN